MNSKAPINHFSTMTFIPWLGAENESWSLRGLHWGARKANFIVSGAVLVTNLTDDAVDSESDDSGVRISKVEI